MLIPPSLKESVPLRVS